MRNALDLFSFQGRVSRKGYLLAGLFLFAIKYAGDLAISRLNDQSWNPLMYVSPRVSPLAHPGDHGRYLIELFAWALPFIWMGLSLTVRRLRDIGVHPFYAGFFFLPFVHIALFAALVIAPPHKEMEKPATPDAGPFRDGASGPPLPVAEPPKFLMRAIPRSKPAAYLFALISTLAAGLLCYVITVQISQKLGTMLFIGLPFGMSFWVAFCVTYGRTTGAWAAIGYGLSPIGIALLLLCAMAFEGLACIIMALPIVVSVGALGAVIGWLCARNPNLNRLAPLLVILIPGLVGFDVIRPNDPAPLSVVSIVKINAPIATVWKNVISFPPIDSPPAPIFAIVAMPIEARIDGHDPGATRRCIFTNGTFVEPIKVWDEPRELTFGVQSQPQHLDEYVDINQGQFLLHDNGDGTTTLQGTTWYKLRVFPTAYWSMWAQTFLHSIHMRVLDHIKRISEQPHAPLARAAEMPAWMAASNATCDCTRHAQAAP